LRSKPILELRDLHVEFVSLRRGHPPVEALRGVSLTISPGEILGIVGESGAGKSLTGAAVIGLLEPPARLSGGEIWFDGRRIDNLGEKQMRRMRGRRIGAIFQDPMTALNPLLTIGEQLIETIRVHLGMTKPEARQRSVELLESVGVAAAGERLQHYPHQFSGGMRQRVVIALAIAADPSLVIADEPTTALDVSVQAQVLGLLRQLCRRRGTAIMLVTHDMGVIAETAGRVAVMYAGRVVEMGAVNDVLNRPAHPYTHGLMGAIPVIGTDGMRRLPQVPGAMPRPESLPAGCPFHPRCARAQDACRAGLPPFRSVGATEAACFFPINEISCSLSTLSAECRTGQVHLS
jgi:peptide/nickel transport system ATP-binding protein